MRTETKLDFSEYDNPADPYGQYFPGHIRDGLELWVSDGVYPGDFLTAVLSNDLFGAFARADETNQRYLKGICWFIYNHTPAPSWGSVAKMKEWQKRVQGE